MKSFPLVVAISCLLFQACSKKQTEAQKAAPSKPVANATSKPKPSNDALTGTANYGELKITFKLKGPLPPATPIAVTNDNQFCGNGTLTDETLIVDPATRGIQNVVVYVYTGRRGSQLAPQPPRNRILTLDNKNCRFEPHILLAQTGDSIKVTNSDPVGHNANIAFFNNSVASFVVPAGAPKLTKLQKPEPTLIPVACNIHPWMAAHLLVVDHPFFAASDKQGVLTIKGLPPGKLIFRAWHEKLTFKNQILINGTADQWKSNKFELDIKRGLNDLGVVEVP